MKKPVVIIGLGEIGDYFAGGFLKLGHPVLPVLRGESAARWQQQGVDPEMVVVAVGEIELAPVLKTLPSAWHDRVVLLQNELLPDDYLLHGITDPTVVVVWLDKKKGRPVVHVLPNRVAGPKAAGVVAALTRQGSPTLEVLPDRIIYEMVRKNLYILTVNIAGIQTGVTVSDLWSGHQALVLAISDEILTIQFARLGKVLSRAELIHGLCEAFDGDPHHLCMGRSAPERLQRAREQAAFHGIPTPALDAIAALLPAS